MKVSDITPVEDGEITKVVCPVCGQVWLTSEESVANPCKHLRLFWHEDCSPEFFGKWNHKRFGKAYLKTLSKLDPDDEHALDSGPNHNALEKMESTDITEVLVWTETGMACGPVSFSTYFGLFKETP